MRDINFQLKALTSRCNEGSRATQAARSRILLLSANELWDMGFKLKRPENLKPKHIAALNEHWARKNLSASTRKNRMSALRWWAQKIDKASMIHQSNAQYEIPQRRMYQGNKAAHLDLQRVDAISCPRVQMSLRLMAAFGLRREEAIKFAPAEADKGNRIELKGTWCKGNRSREVEILTARQRALLDEAKALAGSGSLIPPDLSYKEQLKRFENFTAAAGIKNPHGLRHAYAQWLYKVTTGMPARAAGGPSYKRMTPEQRAAHEWGRKRVSHALGHNRTEVTAAYGI